MAASNQSPLSLSIYLAQNAAGPEWLSHNDESLRRLYDHRFAESGQECHDFFMHYAHSLADQPPEHWEPLEIHAERGSVGE
jgi:hypothetical protein